MSIDGVHESIRWVGLFLELTGIAVILVGTLYATAQVLRRVYAAAPEETLFRAYRTRLGRSILLGLEFLVAGDIIRSVTVEPSFRSVGVLSVIVLIRTFLSFTLEVEMNGRWPWQREPARRE